MDATNIPLADWVAFETWLQGQPAATRELSLQERAAAFAEAAASLERQVKLTGQHLPQNACSCGENECRQGIQPPRDCIGRLSGLVERRRCERCLVGEDERTWHHNGECIRCRGQHRYAVTIHGGHGMGQSAAVQAMALHYGKAQVLNLADWPEGKPLPDDALVLALDAVPGAIPFARALAEARYSDPEAAPVGDQVQQLDQLQQQLDQAAAAPAAERALPRCGDAVLHRPSGEVWLVAYADASTDTLAPAGWPDSRARLSDCELVRRCDDAGHLLHVEGWRKASAGDGDTRRANVLRRYGTAAERAA